MPGREPHDVTGRSTPSDRAGRACCPRRPRNWTTGLKSGTDEVRISVERLNLDAASFRQLATKHDGDGEKVKAEVLEIIGTRGKMQNPVTGSGGMLIGTVDAVGPDSPLGLEVGDRVATLVSLTLTPLPITDDLARWDGRSEQVPAAGHAILFARSIAAVLPDDLDPELSLAVLDVCGAPGADRPRRRAVRPTRRSPSSAAPASPARSPWPPPVAPAPSAPSASCRSSTRRGACATSRSPTRSRSPTPATRSRSPTRSPKRSAARPTSRSSASTYPAANTARSCPPANGGTVIFFSMATSFAAAALGAEGLAADVTMLIGNGYVPGHADYAMELLRTDAGVRAVVRCAPGGRERKLIP